jgi:hypothetical protein
VVCFGSTCGFDARRRPRFTATLNPASRPGDEALGGFLGASRVLLRTILGAPTTSELFTVGLDAAGGYPLSNRIGTDPPGFP